VTLRSLAADDEVGVCGWLTDFYRQHQDWWATGYGQRPVADVAGLVGREWQELDLAANSPHSLVAVIEDDGRAAGIVQAGIRADRTMGFRIGVLQWIYLDPAARGQGLADRLMRHALAWMDQQGVSGREVFVTALNPAAVRLYRRHGFEVADYRMLARAPSILEV
jgi:ribosomal protein S18 acetylase RimI-like enzyme